jgi:hypothetical protein
MLFDKLTFMGYLRGWGGSIIRKLHQSIPQASADKVCALLTNCGVRNIRSKAFYLFQKPYSFFKSQLGFVKTSSPLRFKKLCLFGVPEAVLSGEAPVI